MTSFLTRLVAKLAALPAPDSEILDLLHDAADMLDRPPIIAVGDAAREYGVPYSTIIRAVNGGHLEAWQSRATILLDREDFENWKATVYRPGLRLPKKEAKK